MVGSRSRANRGPVRDSLEPSPVQVAQEREPYLDGLNTRESTRIV
jgi:hypothetical protein